MFRYCLSWFSILLVIILFLSTNCAVKTPFYGAKETSISSDRIVLEKKDQIKKFEGRIREGLQRGFLPIIDVEFHYGQRIEIEKLVKRMDENGVALTWLAPAGDRGRSEVSLALDERYPDRIVPTTVSGDGKLWHSSDKGFLDRLATVVRSGRYFAMGEFEARHYYAGPSTSPDANTRVDSEAMKVVFELSKENNIPFLLHHEAEDTLLPELELMLGRYPEAKVIWCHAGRNRNPNTWKKFRKAEAVREFLQKYPNLHFDFLASPPGATFSGYVQGIMYKISFQGVTLDPEWKKVIEEFPDRFVLGSDVAPLRFEGWYDRVFDDYRNIILQGVRKDVAEMIAYKNAWKLMTGEDWVD
jgi:hypothetical protein